MRKPATGKFVAKIERSIPKIAIASRTTRRFGS